MIRCHTTCDENFYVGLTTCSSESNLDKHNPPLKPFIYRKYGETHYIAFWRDINPPQGTIVDHELCFKDWVATNTTRCACLPISGAVRFIKLMQKYPAGFLEPPKVQNLKELRTEQGTLRSENPRRRNKDGKRRKGMRGKKRRKTIAE